MKIKNIAWLVLVALSGCTSVNSEKDVNAISTNNKENIAQTRSYDKWISKYNSPELESLIKIAIIENKDAENTLSKIRTINEQYKLAGVENDRKNQVGNKLVEMEIASLTLETPYQKTFFEEVKKYELSADKQPVKQTILQNFNRIILTNQVLKLYAYKGYLTDKNDILKNKEQGFKKLLTLEKNKVSVGIGNKEFQNYLESIISTMERSREINKLKINLTETSLKLLVNNNKTALSILDKDTNRLYKSHIELPDHVTLNQLAFRPDLAYLLLVLEDKKSSIEKFMKGSYTDVTIRGDGNAIKDLEKAKKEPSSVFPYLVKADGANSKDEQDAYISFYNKKLVVVVENIDKLLGQLEKNDQLLEIRNKKYDESNQAFLKMKASYGTGNVEKNDVIKKEIDYANEELEYFINKLKNFNSRVDLMNSIAIP